MKGIEWRSDNAEAFLDEIPGACKDIDQVMEDARDLVTVDHTLRQILNVKGDWERRPCGSAEPPRRPQEVTQGAFGVVEEDARRANREGVVVADGAQRLRLVHQRETAGPKAVGEQVQERLTVRAVVRGHDTPP